MPKHFRDFEKNGKIIKKKKENLFGNICKLHNSYFVIFGCFVNLFFWDFVYIFLDNRRAAIYVYIYIYELVVRFVCVDVWMCVCIYVWICVGSGREHQGASGEPQSTKSGILERPRATRSQERPRASRSAQESPKEQSLNFYIENETKSRVEIIQNHIGMIFCGICVAERRFQK